MSGKTVAILWLAISVAMTISSLFVFSVGWDKLKDYLESSTIEGRIQGATLAGLSLEPQLALTELSGPEQIQITITPDGQFSHEETPPGKYKLEISGRNIRKVERVIDIPKKKTIDLARIFHAIA